MPIIDVEIVLRADEAIPDGLVSELADELGEILHSARQETWVKVHPFAADQYAENGGRPGAVFPVFVMVMKSELPSFEEMQNEVARITDAVAKICGRPSENVHVIYQPEGKGRVAFGGKIVS
jgi:phenylpyruvate tautomerase PptA (4-oxalocrotonate tautomerase family)